MALWGCIKGDTKPKQASLFELLFSILSIQLLHAVSMASYASDPSRANRCEILPLSCLA